MIMVCVFVASQLGLVISKARSIALATPDNIVTGSMEARRTPHQQVGIKTLAVQ